MIDSVARGSLLMPHQLLHMKVGVHVSKGAKGKRVDEIGREGVGEGVG